MICTKLQSIQMVDISENPLSNNHPNLFKQLKDSLHKNVSCHLKTENHSKDLNLTFKIKSQAKAMKRNGQSFSLPRLVKINLKPSLQEYPRPPVIKTKEFKRKKKKTNFKLQYQDAVSLTLKEIEVDSNKIFPPKEKGNHEDNLFSNTELKEDNKDEFFLTQENSHQQWEPKNTSMSRSFSQKNFESIKGNISNQSIEEKEVLKLLLQNEPKQKNESSYVEMDSEFMLNNPKANTQEFGNIKINTMNEWARLSLLDHDKQINYKGTNLPSMRKLANELKIIIKKTDYEYTEKKKTKSHLKESLKAMEFLLQKNAFDLLAIKDQSKELSSVSDLKPTPLMEELKKNFLPLQVLKTGMNPLNTDLLHKEVERCGIIVEKYLKMEDIEDVIESFNSHKSKTK
ncbi:unnamed protein product [Moneuplotes crassus]|uniref:Uncharacterized protein n=1 Tax=Euplotes crassus TaxID=5936 RepID=A0AAD1XT04_EUPCR|nr:unnamed protein product [Moneuplotes crassus]